MKSYPPCINLILLLLLTANPLQAKDKSRNSIGLQQTPPYDSLTRVLEAIYDTDQGIRQKLDSAKADELSNLVGQMQKIDSANQQQVKTILQQYGWLGKSKIGKKASEAVFYVIQHSTIELMRQYLPSLQRLAQTQEASLVYAAMMEDRLLMWEGKKQKYGTQGYSTTTRKPFILPIQDPARVNELRKSVGFEQTIEEYAKQLNATYDPAEKLPAVK